MNKKSLFYFVEKGTNSRVLNNSQKPLIMDGRGVISQREWWPKSRYDEISIKEYESKFEDTFKDKGCEDTPEDEECEDTSESDE